MPRLVTWPALAGVFALAACTDPDPPPPSDRDVRAAARTAESYVVNYSDWDADEIAIAQRHPLVIVDPKNGDMNRALIAEIQRGVDAQDPSDDVVVLAYISVGEDDRSVGKSDDELKRDARFTGDGTGPRSDPRGPDASGEPVVELDPLGMASNGGTGWASWYLDDASVYRSADQRGDGVPDRNDNFGGFFVNAGDPAWFTYLVGATIDGAAGTIGFEEIFSLDHGRGLGCDGVFLDTYDTAAPNEYSDESSDYFAKFEWTAAGFLAFAKRLREAYPDKVILQNRGVFFFDPRTPSYKVNTRGVIDLLLFESFRLNSDPDLPIHPYFHADNLHNFAPKLMAETQRADGFTVLSLGYAEGRDIAKETLFGRSTLGLETLLEDVRLAHATGFRHYITDGDVVLVNGFVHEHASFADAEPPVWTSTWNDHDSAPPTPPGAPTPRVGVQRVEPGPGQIFVRWDVALDLHPVRYVAYAQSAPFDFDADPELLGARRVELEPRLGEGYDDVLELGGRDLFPFEAAIDALTPNTEWFVVIRAHDLSPPANEEKNRVVLSATPFAAEGVFANITIDGAFGDWAGIASSFVDARDVPDSSGPDFTTVAFANDRERLYVRFASENAFNLDGSPSSLYPRWSVFIDADEDPTTGYDLDDGGWHGSEVVVSGEYAFSQAPGEYEVAELGTVTASPAASITDLELAIPLSYFGGATRIGGSVRVVLLNDDAYDYVPREGLSLRVPLAPPP